MSLFHTRSEGHFHEEPFRWYLYVVHQSHILLRLIVWMLYVWDLKRVDSSYSAWWRHQMETFSALLAICAGNSPVPGEFPTQRPVTRSFDVNFDLRPNKRLSKQSWGLWFETLSRPLWRHHNGIDTPKSIKFLNRSLVESIFTSTSADELWKAGPRLNIKTVLSTYGDFHVKDKTAVRTSYL